VAVRRSTLALLAAGTACAAAGLLYRRIRTNEENTMSQVDDAVARVTAAQERNDAAQSAALQRVNDDVTDLRSTVDQLSAQVLNGDGGAIQTAAALDAVTARLEESTARLGTVDPNPDFPAPVPGDEGTDTPAPGDDVVVDNPTPGDSGTGENPDAGSTDNA
jgi:TolA-binding protein